MSGIIGHKIGMTSIYDANGKNQPVTVIKAGPCYVTQVKSIEKDGYTSVQMSFGEVKEKHVNKAQAGHFKKAGVKPAAELVEFKGFEKELKPGDVINVSIFEEGEWVDVVGTSKGKGFQGVVKRHGFGGVGLKHHGQHDRERAPGSIGNSSYASRVFKGMRMAGRMGGNKVKAINLQVLKIIPDNHLMLLKGSVPGANGSTVLVEK